MTRRLSDAEIFAVETTIRARRTSHDFSGGKAPAELLKRCVAVALLAPNHKLTEPLRLTEVGEKTRYALAEVSAARKKSKGDALSPAKWENLLHTYLSAGHLLILRQRLDVREAVCQEDYATIACAVQNMSLLLWAEGFGSKWSTGGVTNDPQTYSVLEIDPAEEKIVGFFWIGKLQDELKAPKRSESFESIYHYID